MFFFKALPLPYLLTILSCSLLVALGPQRTQPQSKDDSLLESGRPSHLQSAVKGDLRIISYNIRWRGGDDLRQLIRLFREDQEIGGASVLLLQEVDRKKKRTGNTNTARLMANELGMYYAWCAPPAAKSDQQEEETGAAILSRHQLTDIKRIVLPNEGPGGRRRVALGATIAAGKTAMRVYSVHSETRIPVERKIEQMRAVLEDLSQYPNSVPAIVAGDFNTWEASAVTKTRKLFTNANFHTPFDDEPTFYRRVVFLPIELKLDWIWVRNLEVLKAGIDRNISLSDHWPLWALLKFPDTTERRTAH